MNHNNKNNPINIGFPLSEENRKRYQEGVDYKIEEMENGYKNYHIFSEQLKADFRRFQGGWVLWNNNIVNEEKFKVPPENSKELERKIKKENEEKRQKFIADNDPPLLKWGFLNEQEKLFNSQQGPLTETEKAALNDPSLTYIGDWEEILWFIQANRRANSDLYSDKDFVWRESRKLKGLPLEVLQRAGVPLDKLFQRVEKGVQVKKEQEKGQQKKDKETILANLNDWVVYGPNTIHNRKTQQGLSWNDGGNFTKHRFFTEYTDEHGESDSNEGVVESYFDPVTFQELRTAIFKNMVKNFATKRNYFSECQKKCGNKILEKGNYFPNEWTQIKEAMEKTTSVSESSDQISPNNSSSPNKLITASLVGGLIILILVWGLFLIKKRKKKNGFKK